MSYCTESQTAKEFGDALLDLDDLTGMLAQSLVQGQ
jgi:hypothetical protein